VAGAGNRDQLAGDAEVLQLRLKDFGLRVRDTFVGGAVDEETRRGVLTETRERRGFVELRAECVIEFGRVIEEGLERGADLSAALAICDEVGWAGEEDHGLGAGAIIGGCGGEGGEVAAGGVADENHAIGVAFELSRVLAHPTDGRADVVDAGRPAVLGSEAVVDREPGKVGVGEWLGGRDVDLGPVAAAPAAAVDENGDWERALPVGDAGIEPQALAACGGVLDVSPQLGSPDRLATYGQEPTDGQEYADRVKSSRHIAIFTCRRNTWQPLQIRRDSSRSAGRLGRWPMVD